MDNFFDFALRGAKSHYRRKPLLDGTYYHAFHRRDDGGDVFVDDKDRDVFLDIIKRLIDPEKYRDARGRALRPLPCRVELLGFCLLTNHFHLVLYVERAEGLTDFMHRLQTSYTMRFNRRHGRKGPMFDDSYGADVITDTRQLKTVLAYVHANPGPRAVGYRWSGHDLYLDHRRAAQEPWFSAEAGLRHFGGRANYLEWFMRALAARMRRNPPR